MWYFFPAQFSNRLKKKKKNPPDTKSHPTKHFLPDATSPNKTGYTSNHTSLDPNCTLSIQIRPEMKSFQIFPFFFVTFHPLSTDLLKKK
jgi:hypothetical protein